MAYIINSAIYVPCRIVKKIMRMVIAKLQNIKTIGKQLLEKYILECEREPRNVKDSYAVAFLKSQSELLQQRHDGWRTCRFQHKGSNCTSLYGLSSCSVLLRLMAFLHFRIQLRYCRR